jgi:hypothetical protein
MGTSRKRFTPFTLDNGWVLEFPTEPAGVLRLGAGKIRFHAHFSERHRGQDGWFSVVECDLRVADAEGACWQATNTFFAQWLLYPLIDLSRKEPARWLRNASLEWREALEQRPLIGGLSAVYDDRFYRHVWIDNTGFCLQFKYLCAGFDIAALSEDRLAVRVSDLFCSWNPLPVAGPDGTPLPLPRPLRIPTDEERNEEDERALEEGRSGDYDTIHPLAYTVDAGRVFFRNAAALDAEGEWQDGETGRPVVFRRVRGKSDPQRLVTSHPKVTLTATAADRGDIDFVPMPSRDALLLEHLTDAGGRLVGKANATNCGIKLDRHPNSASQPADILRCRMRLTDDQGNVWECTSLTTPDLFFEKLVDLDNIDWAEFESGENPWEPGEGAVFDLRAKLDDGAWRYALLSDVVAFHADGQRATVDVRPGEDGFSVRVKGLVGRKRPVEPQDSFYVLDPAGRAAEVPAWEHEQPLPPILFGIRFLDLAFRNTTFAVDEGFWHNNTIPIPVVFTRVGKGEPRPGVRFVADRT